MKTREKNSRERHLGEPSFWVISAEHAGKAGLSGMLTTQCGAEASDVEALAVFGFEEEASVFFESCKESLGGESAWRLRRTTIRELLSVFEESCKNIGWVTLDPLPFVTRAASRETPRMSREEFTEFLVRRARA